MKTNFNLYIFVIILFVAFNCNSEYEVGSDFSALKEAATTTSLNFNNSDIEKEFSSYIEIPEEYWAIEIKDENPIKVYSYNNNIALVQKETAVTEEGLYIHVLFSSFVPHTDEHVEYSFVEAGVYEFVKNK